METSTARSATGAGNTALTSERRTSPAHAGRATGLGSHTAGILQNQSGSQVVAQLLLSRSYVAPAPPSRIPETRGPVARRVHRHNTRSAARRRRTTPSEPRSPSPHPSPVSEPASDCTNPGNANRYHCSPGCLSLLEAPHTTLHRHPGQMIWSNCRSQRIRAGT